jgi:hypothetical protein
MGIVQAHDTGNANTAHMLMPIRIIENGGLT